MAKVKILKCEVCGAYGIKETCSCGGKRVDVRPPKYSPEDKYGKYRRKEKAKLLGINE